MPTPNVTYSISQEPWVDGTRFEVNEHRDLGNGKITTRTLQSFIDPINAQYYIDQLKKEGGEKL